MVKIEKRILSPTAINTYLSCPRKYYLRYIKRLKTKPSIHLLRGSIVHKAIHEFHKNQPRIFHELPQGMVSHELLSKFNQQWEKAEEQLNALELADEQIEFYYEDSRQMILNFWRWFCKRDVTPADRSEVRLFSKNLGLMGIIDAVHTSGEKVTLIDYKTSKYAKITNDILRQAAIYALLYQDKYNIVPDVVGIHFLKEEGDPQPVQIDEEILEYAKITIESIREKTNSKSEEAYPCTCGGYCDRDFSG